MGIIVNSTVESRIDGVAVLPLKQIEDERGAVLHMLRSDSPLFSRFGEIYFSIVNPGTVKAWKRHRAMTQHFAVPVGRIRLVVFDDRADSPSKGQIEEIILGRTDRYYLVCIPPMLWYGFQGMSNLPALLANCSDIPHDPNESEQLPLSNDCISYNWSEDD
jgi:dTDP-4-dehydrorhamnose 3,5-epimerase